MSYTYPRTICTGHLTWTFRDQAEADAMTRFLDTRARAFEMQYNYVSRLAPDDRCEACFEIVVGDRVVRHCFKRNLDIGYEFDNLDLILNA